MYIPQAFVLVRAVVRLEKKRHEERVVFFSLLVFRWALASLPTAQVRMHEAARFLVAFHSKHQTAGYHIHTVPVKVISFYNCSLSLYGFTLNFPPHINLSNAFMLTIKMHTHSFGTSLHCDERKASIDFLKL